MATKSFTFSSVKISKSSEVEILIEMSRIENFYHWKYYKRIGIDLARQTNTSIPQQINLVRWLEEKYDAKMFFIAKMQQETVLIFSLNSLILTE